MYANVIEVIFENNYLNRAHSSRNQGSGIKRDRKLIL